LSLLGWEADRVEARPGDAIEPWSYWAITKPVTSPLKIFVHVSAPDGKIVAQWDGLDVNIGTLESGDVFVQRHRLEMPGDLPPGPYRISIGAYHPDTGDRLRSEFDGHSIDSIVLGMLNVR
jgi:hypothetical protein